MTQAARTLGWLGIVRVGLVQTALGAIVVLTTSTLNRIMVVELALPAMLPGALVAIHYVLQVMRPRMGYGSDIGGRRTPWILGGMAVLAAGGALAAAAVATMGAHLAAGIAIATVAFVLIGAGVGAAGTNLLVLLATRVDARRRPAAATVVWVMMIAGFIITSVAAGHLLDPYSPARLVAISTGVSLVAFVLACAAVWGMESGAAPPKAAPSPPPRGGFRDALVEVWSEPQSRRFAIFVLVSMLAYSAQDLILEPFAGTVFAYTPGETTKLSGVQHGGVLSGMILVAVVATGIGGPRLGSLRAWTVGGCIASAAALLALAYGGTFGGPTFPLNAAVFALGLANGTYAVAAIGSMMDLVGAGTASREGTRMGLWGAAQALAFGAGGLLGAGLADLCRWMLGSARLGYVSVFALESLAFLVAGAIALRLGSLREERMTVGVGLPTPEQLPDLVGR